MKEKIAEIIEHFDSLEEQFSSQDVLGNPDLMKKIAQERSKLEPVVTKGREYLDLLNQLSDTSELLSGDDPEIIELAKEEINELELKEKVLEKELVILLLPRDPNDDKSIIKEMRAGTGGEEAALFAADLFRMYSHFAENSKMSIKIMDAHETGIGGMKSITFSSESVDSNPNCSVDSFTDSVWMLLIGFFLNLKITPIITAIMIPVIAMIIEG